MTTRLPPTPLRSVRSSGGMVASADQLATQAGLAILALGGNAIDAAIATNAAIAVTGPHLCGMGGDLFALVCADGKVEALNASGRAPAAADAGAQALRSEGFTEMAFRHDIRAVTVPGCVDGWLALHQRFGSLPLQVVLAPAIQLAAGGFPASPLLVGSLAQLDHEARHRLAELADQARSPGARVRRPGVAAALSAVAADGRDGFYLGDFGRGLQAICGAGHDGWFAEADMTTSQAEWQPALAGDMWGVRLHTIAPNSQGYLTLAAASIVDQLGLPADPDAVAWAHLTIEAARAAAHDRPSVLHDRADGRQLLAAAAARAHQVDANRAALHGGPTRNGDTTYLCVVDGAGMAVSLIQSNASGFGSWLVEPTTGINLHNRGMGFSLDDASPARLEAGRRPPHTLAPLLATNTDGTLRAVLGTMGGDAQPQILLQLAARLFAHGQSPAGAVAAGRWALRGPRTGFDTWTSSDQPVVQLEAHCPDEWVASLAAKGHRVALTPSWDSSFGHAHVILREPDGMLVGAADPRAVVGSAAGL